jgi:Asp-tRNA(Asn)/Glu-tRNA(Gln) amidotransferase B subunit
MIIDKDLFALRLQKEIRRLEERAMDTPGEERKLFDEMVAVLHRDLRTLQSIDAIAQYFEETEQMNAQSAIIDILNRIELQLVEIKSALNNPSIPFQPSLQEADEIIERFFVTCQIAENVIKHAERRKYITKTHLRQLNEQLKQNVDTMIQLSQQSERLFTALQRSQEAKMVLEGF